MYYLNLQLSFFYHFMEIFFPVCRIIFLCHLSVSLRRIVIHQSFYSSSKSHYDKWYYPSCKLEYLISVKRLRLDLYFSLLSLFEHYLKKNLGLCPNTTQMWDDSTLKYLRNVKTAKENHSSIVWKDENSDEKYKEINEGKPFFPVLGKFTWVFKGKNPRLN